MSSRPTPSQWNPALLQGISAALFSAFASGLVPIFGKQAFEAGVAPFSVVMLRTVGAAGVLWLVYLFWRRKYIYIYPFGLAACLTAGVINGLGSLLYYTSLQNINASIGQLLFTLYLMFLTLFSWLDGYRISRLTLLRLILALIAVILLKWTRDGQADWVAGLMMIAAGALYALHVSVNQHTLYDIPSPTVTLYTLTGMAGTVFIAYLLGGLPALPMTFNAWSPVLLLTAVTIISRLTLFIGVKHLGGMQTVLINLSEALFTIVAARLVLGESLSPIQWLGVAVLVFSILLVTREASLGAIPRPKPWLQIFTAWFAVLSQLFEPAPEWPARASRPGAKIKIMPPHPPERGE